MRQRPDMTIAVDWDVNHNFKQTKHVVILVLLLILFDFLFYILVNGQWNVGTLLPFCQWTAKCALKYNQPSKNMNFIYRENLETSLFAVFLDLFCLFV